MKKKSSQGKLSLQFETIELVNALLPTTDAERVAADTEGVAGGTVCGGNSRLTESWKASCNQ